MRTLSVLGSCLLLTACASQPVFQAPPAHGKYTIVSRFSNGLVFEKQGKLPFGDRQFAVAETDDRAIPMQMAISDFIGQNYDISYVPVSFRFSSYPDASGDSVAFFKQIADDQVLSATDTAALSKITGPAGIDVVILITEGDFYRDRLHTAYGHGTQYMDTVVKDFFFGYAIYDITVYDAHTWAQVSQYVGMDAMNLQPLNWPDDVKSVSAQTIDSVHQATTSLWPPKDVPLALCYLGFDRDVQVADDHTRAYDCFQKHRPVGSAGAVNIPSYWFMHPPAGHADLHQ